MTLSERHVQAIWYDEKLRPEKLVTRRGSTVRVISPGEWNLEAGPDFRRAVLEIGPDQRRLVGDVEVHLCPNDWDLHGHGENSAYRNVIAHVTWSNGPRPKTLPPEAISIWLGRFLLARPDFSVDEIDLTAYPFACVPLPERPCEHTVGHSPDEAKKLLTAAGQRRLLLKARRLTGILCERMRRASSVTCAREQVFYEEVMAAFGYKYNAPSFRHVAERVPRTAGLIAFDLLKAAFLAASGFESWNKSACRPNNSPQRRLSTAAWLMTETSLLSTAEASDFSRDACRRQLAEICLKPPMPDIPALGRGRAAALLANVILPFALAEGRVQNFPDWLPPEDISHPVRLTANRLFGRDHNPRALYASNGLLIQGLLHIHRTRCLVHHPACADCSFADLIRAPSPNP